MIMKQTFTNSKGSFLFLLLFYAVFSNQGANAQTQAVSEIITDYQGYWKSGSAALNPVRPENSHDLLSFTHNGVRYSTGVNDALLTTNGDTFSAQQFVALPMENMSGTPTQNTFIGLGQMYDGVNNGGSTPPPLNNLPFYLTDGAQGLNLGTCATNIPVGYVSFQITQVNPAAIGDGIPDILITQIADPSGSTDVYAFKDSNGATVGNSMNIVLNNITPVANWLADFYRITANPMFIPPGFVNTPRPIRLWAADFSDFGITAANINNIDHFVINLKGNSDIAFIAYNFATAVVVPLTPGVALLKEGTFVDSNEDCKASAGDTINYTFKVTNTGQSELTNVMVTDPTVTVSGNAIASLASGASNATNFTATYTITQADVDAGAVYNSATVRGINPTDNNAVVTSVSHDPTPIPASSPLYDPECQFCTVTPLLQTPTLTGPSSLEVEGCGTAALTLPFSATPSTITLAQFIAAGGTTSNSTLPHIITYFDVQLGTCPTVVTRTFAVVNGCLTSTFVQTITINDTLNPTASAPASINVQGCNTSFPQPDVTVVTDAADECSTATVSFVSDSDIRINGCVETIIRTYKVEDACGNFVNVEQTLTRTSDKTAPTASNPGDLVIDANEPLPAADVTVVTDEADNCSEPTVTFVSDSAPTATDCTVTIVRTYKVTDACNNAIEVTQNIIRNFDDVDPVTPTIPDATGPCSVTVTPPTTTDICAGPITGTTTDPLEYTEQGSYVITWTFNDGNGNSVTALQNVIVDSEATPTITLPNINEQCSVTVTVPTFTNACNGEVIIGTTTDPLSYTVQGEYTINWTFDFGNSVIVNAPQMVTVQDTVDPIQPVFTPLVADCSVVLTAPTTTDDCAGTVTGTTSDPLTYSVVGTYIVHWTFNDGNGNEVTADQSVTITDTVAPVVPVLLQLTGQCSVTAVPPTTSDACAGTITATTTDPLTYDIEGTYTITWIFSDGNGNSTPAFQTVIIDDTVNPETPTLAEVTGQCTATATVPTTTDACAGTITGTTTDSVVYSTPGTYTITWTFDDGNGNSFNVPQTVIVTAPTTTFLPEVLAECNNQTDGVTVNLSALLASDVPTTGTWADIDNSGGLQGTNFVSAGINVGVYTLRYTLVEGTCTKIFDVEVRVDDDCPQVADCGTVEVRNAFSPNNDGVNDVFIIDNIDDDCHAVNSIEIFNRWGVMVYDAKGYNNADVSFKGISEGRATVAKDSELPTGTYFYILVFTDGDGTTVKRDGYLYLSR